MEVKVRLSMSVPGAQMLSSQECDKNPKENYNVESINVSFKTKKGKFHKENILVKTRKQQLIKQSISISKEAYEFMTDASLPPTEKLAKRIYITKIVERGKGDKPKKVTIQSTLWGQMSLKKRLNWHMARIAENFGAVDYQFEILDD